MKSPWRFLADLTSRPKTQVSPLVPAAPEKPAEDQAGDQDVAPALSVTIAEPTGHLVETTDSAAASPVTSSSVVGTVVEASEVTSRLTSESAVDIVEPDVAIERPAPTPVAIAPANLGEVEALSRPSKNRSKRIKPGSVQVVTQFRSKPSDDPRAVSPPAQPLTFLEEVVVLDEEIAALKAGLALKLKLQNAQLKKMLERFDIR
ncbi:hypothetical protein Rleg4DRAFT_2449 [Rhizobium leguminosarum bv. trifolii WSM2297]|uniref:Uncharacterized protein n=1 Tax=Rhizobium leguminosarum bv. trifolii WSM2297 TaxID=754762 RepID=J0W4Z0_RHILT|nr:hypothetical protein [Rhizobium leguminosarum]EJC80791.1 hypothetical protein Rleg4DRAFT_2449 [Rhizobium leguminosarum bv. trifolii WSM2297]